MISNTHLVQAVLFLGIHVTLSLLVHSINNSPLFTFDLLSSYKPFKRTSVFSLSPLLSLDRIDKRPFQRLDLILCFPDVKKAAFCLSSSFRQLNPNKLTFHKQHSILSHSLPSLCHLLTPLLTFKTQAKPAAKTLT